MKPVSLVAAPLLAGLAVAGCGGSSPAASNVSNAANTAPSGAYRTTARAPVAAPAAAATITTKSSKLGTVLAAGPKRLTVYLFEADRSTRSRCAGACASAWPPVITAAAPRASGHAQASRLGVTVRSDGRRQVTYGGHPLYYFIKDKDAGDAYGQGVSAFGANWYTLAPTGKKIDKS